MTSLPPPKKKKVTNAKTERKVSAGLEQLKVTEKGEEDETEKKRRGIFQVEIFQGESVKKKKKKEEKKNGCDGMGIVIRRKNQ